MYSAVPHGGAEWWRYTAFCRLPFFYTWVPRTHRFNSKWVLFIRDCIFRFSPEKTFLSSNLCRAPEARGSIGKKKLHRYRISVDVSRWGGGLQQCQKVTPGCFQFSPSPPWFLFCPGILHYLYLVILFGHSQPCEACDLFDVDISFGRRP